MGLGIENHEIDPELEEMIGAWADFEQFGILPWDRNAKTDDVYTYWKNGIRYIDQMHSQARANKQGNNRGKLDTDLEQDHRRQQLRRKMIGHR